ncbi:hypothetical protein FXO37_01890 [Capsicum annuum]|nr:hypothetical protein FXO37_01890 [Capsicum annuum]
MALRSRIDLITTDTPDWTCKVQIVDISRERKSSEKQILFQNLLLEDEEDSPKSYARQYIHITGYLEIKKPLPPPTKLNLTPLANVAQLTPTPSAEIGSELQAKMEKEEYPVILGRNIGISSYQGLSLQIKFDTTIRIDPSNPQALELLDWVKSNKRILSGQASTVLSSRASDSFSASSTPLIVAFDPHKVTSIAEMISQTSLLRLDHIHQMLSNKLFNIQLKKSSWVSANLTRTSLTIVSFTEKEQLLPLTIAQRNAKKVRPLATSELGMEPTIVESGSSSAAPALEPLTPAKNKLSG